MMTATVFIGGAFLFLVFALYLMTRGSAVTVAHPLVLFLGVYSIVCFALPGTAIAAGWFRHQARYSPTAVSLSAAFLLLFAAAVVAGFFLGGGTRWSERSTVFRPRRWQQVPRWQWVLLTTIVAAGLCVASAWLIHTLAAHGWSGYIANRVVLRSGSGYSIMGLRWPFVLLVAFAAQSYASKRETRKRHMRGRTAILIVLALTLSGLGVVQGSRTDMILPLVCVVWIIAGMTHEASRTALATGSIAGLIIVAVALGPIRQQLMSQHGGIGKPLLQQDLTEQLARTFGEAENLIWLMENGKREDRLWGASFVAVATGMVPRAMWPEKPLGAGPRLRNMIQPGSYDLRGERVTSFTPGLPAEAYMNFGWAGAVIVGGLLGLALSLIARLGARVQNPLHCATWLLLTLSSLFLLKNEVFGVVARLFTTLVPLLLVLFAGALLRQRKGNTVFHGSSARLTKAATDAMQAR